jgi:hypothetical protein
VRFSKKTTGSIITPEFLKISATAMMATTTLTFPSNFNINDPFASSMNNDGTTTILAYGALLSEASSRLTFPDLKNFRHVQVRGLRRVFAHPHLFLLQTTAGLIDPTETMAFASLSAERVVVDSDSSSSTSSSSSSSSSFVAAAFDVVMDDEQKRAFVKREVSYDFVSVPYYNLKAAEESLLNRRSDEKPNGQGVICVASTDERQGAAVVELLSQLPKPLPITSIWHWPRNSGLLPANVYLRHCLLAIEKSGSAAARESFFKDTYLVDRITTLEHYLSDPIVLEQVMKSRPPPELATRFGG